MKLFFATVYWRRDNRWDQETSMRLWAESYDHANDMIHADYPHIERIKIKDISWSLETQE